MTARLGNLTRPLRGGPLSKREGSLTTNANKKARL